MSAALFGFSPVIGKLLIGNMWPILLAGLSPIIAAAAMSLSSVTVSYL